MLPANVVKYNSDVGVVWDSRRCFNYNCEAILGLRKQRDVPLSFYRKARKTNWRFRVFKKTFGAEKKGFIHFDYYRTSPCTLINYNFLKLHRGSAINLADASRNIIPRTRQPYR